jgi:protein deglycase
MVYIHFATGFEEVEAITPVDVLRRAGIEVKTVSVMGNRFVMGSHGISIETDLLFEEVDYSLGTMIVLPGGMPGTKNLAAHTGLEGHIVEYASQGKWIAAICAAPMILGELGILKGKTAVIFPGMEDHLLGAKVGKKSVEVDGNVITSKGAGTAMDFSFVLVEKLKTATMADSLKKAMVFR